MPEKNLMLVRRPNKISNEEHKHRINTTKMSKIVTLRKKNWIGHVLRMANMIYVTAMTWHYEGRRKVGRSKKKST